MSRPEIHGFCDENFSAILDEFARNFETRGELGASVCAYIDGEKVVDLWGGHKDRRRQSAWTEDTISIIFSNAKALTALCLQILIDRGECALDALVSDYWPEFAQNGKEMVTVRMMLCHQSGVPALRAPVKRDGYHDFDYMAQRLAAEAPFWPPGSQHGYHLITYGWTVGELVRRISGKSLGTFFKDEIAEPLGLDLHIGLPDSEFDRVSFMRPPKISPDDERTDFANALLTDRKSLQFLAYMNSGKYFYDDPNTWRAEIGGGGAIGNARSLAGLWAPLAGGDGQYLSAARIDDMRQEQSAEAKDPTLLVSTRFSQGFMLAMNNPDAPGDGNSYIIGEQAFGHAGMGGSCGFADRECNLAFAYTMNQMGGGILLSDRGQSLVDATYRSLGYTNITSGAWTR